MKLNYKRVTNGNNVWHIDGDIDESGTVVITQTYGDITDQAGLSDAVKNMLFQEGFMTRHQAE